MNEMKHTQLPWHVGGADAETGQINIIGDPHHGFYVCGVIAGVESQEANAEFIVRACNGHDDLLEALRTIAKFGTCAASRDTARAAIAKAEGRA